MAKKAVKKKAIENTWAIVRQIEEVLLSSRIQTRSSWNLSFLEIRPSDNLKNAKKNSSRRQRKVCRKKDFLRLWKNLFLLRRNFSLELLYQKLPSKMTFH